MATRKKITLEAPPPAPSFVESVFEKTLSIAGKKLQQHQKLPDLMKKASRAAYLLHEIAKGNPKAAEHAEHSSIELRLVLQDMGAELDWDL